MAQPHIFTPEFRAVWCSIFKPAAGMNPKPGDKLKYSIKCAFPPEADLTEMKAQAAQAAADKFGDKLKDAKFAKTLNSPFRENADLDNPVAGIGDDWTIVTLSAWEDKFSPNRNVVDASGDPITDELDVYSGAWFWAQTNAYAYDNSGNRGVAFSLSNLQKLRDGESLGNAAPPANKVFKAVPGAGPAKTAAGIFG